MSIILSIYDVLITVSLRRLVPSLLIIQIYPRDLESVTGKRRLNV